MNWFAVLALVGTLLATLGSAWAVSAVARRQLTFKRAYVVAGLSLVCVVVVAVAFVSRPQYSTAPPDTTTSSSSTPDTTDNSPTTATTGPGPSTTIRPVATTAAPSTLAVRFVDADDDRRADFVIYGSEILAVPAKDEGWKLDGGVAAVIGAILGAVIAVSQMLVNARKDDTATTKLTSVLTRIERRLPDPDDQPAQEPGA